MTVQLYAQPYDLAAIGFYFDDLETYRARAVKLKNSYGQPVEEFEIQFIEGADLDCALAKAYEINQANLAQFYQAIENWKDDEKIIFIIAVGECGYNFDSNSVDPNDFDIDLYEVENMNELAEQFVEDGLFGDIPAALQFYIDTDAIARDLAIDYSETTIVGHHHVYRCV